MAGGCYIKPEGQNRHKPVPPMTIQRDPASIAPAQAMDATGYEMLADVLHRAYNQAARGKGRERHARPMEAFDQQTMQDMAKRFGVGSLLGQAFKKSEESQRLPRERAVNELLGSIVYLAGAVIALERQFKAHEMVDGSDE